MIENKVVKKARAEEIIHLLKKEYPNSKCSLKYGSPHELLVATILSAQCTDHRVNQVLPGLFKAYPTVNAFAFTDLDKISQEIRGEGEAKALEIYANSFSKDAKFYEFLRTLETYEKVIDKKTTLVLPSDSKLFKELTQ